MTALNIYVKCVFKEFVADVINFKSPNGNTIIISIYFRTTYDFLREMASKGFQECNHANTSLTLFSGIINITVEVLI